jgi:hypothetical protein
MTIADYPDNRDVSTNSTTWAIGAFSFCKITKIDIKNPDFSGDFERETGLGPATPTLARLCSTN